MIPVWGLVFILVDLIYTLTKDMLVWVIYTVRRGTCCVHQFIQRISISPDPNNVINSFDGVNRGHFATRCKICRLPPKIVCLHSRSIPGTGSKRWHISDQHHNDWSVFISCQSKNIDMVDLRRCLRVSCNLNKWRICAFLTVRTYLDVLNIFLYGPETYACSDGYWWQW